jgi:hypothetical protein
LLEGTCHLLCRPLGHRHGLLRHIHRLLRGSGCLLRGGGSPFGLPESLFGGRVNLLDRRVRLIRRLLESTSDLLGRLLGRCRGLLGHLLQSARGLLGRLLGRGGGLLGDRLGILGGRRSRLTCRLRILGRRFRFPCSDNGLTDLLLKRSRATSEFLDLSGHVIDSPTRFGDAVAYLFGPTLGEARFRGQFIQLRAKVRLGLQESLDVLLSFLSRLLQSGSQVHVRPLLAGLEIGVGLRELALEV